MHTYACAYSELWGNPTAYQTTGSQEGLTYTIVHESQDNSPKVTGRKILGSPDDLHLCFLSTLRATCDRVRGQTLAVIYHELGSAALEPPSRVRLRKLCASAK